MKVCVFCGSSGGHHEAYVKAGAELGTKLAKDGFDLVYGGASIGVMGAMADAALESSGTVYGVMPRKLVEREVSHTGLTHFEVVEDMHVRKMKMYDLSEIFVALPGGMGTLDEFCETVCWAQINYHSKRCFLLNLNGFYDAFIDHIGRTIKEGFMAPEHMDLIEVVTTVDELMEKLQEVKNGNV